MDTEKHNCEFNANFITVLMLIIMIVLSFIPVVMFVSWGFALLIFYNARNSDFVKDYAKQMASVYITYALIQIVLALITMITFIVSGIVSSFMMWRGLDYFFGAAIGTTVLSILGVVVSVVYAIFVIIASVKAYKYEKYDIPLNFSFARGWVDKIIVKINEKIETKQASRG